MKQVCTLACPVLGGGSRGAKYLIYRCVPNAPRLVPGRHCSYQVNPEVV